MAGPELLFISAGMQVLGGMKAAKGAKQEAAGARQQAEAQAQAAEYNAKAASYEAMSEESRRRRESERQMGSIRAGRAKSGATMSGSALQVLADSAMEAEIDALSARWSGENQASLYRREAAGHKQAGRIATATGKSRAGTALLSGLAGGAAAGAQGFSMMG